MITRADLPVYSQERGLLCVKPTGFDVDPVTGFMPMCDAPATYVGVRRGDGWVSGTVWCAEHAERDIERGQFGLFTWQPVTD